LFPDPDFRFYFALARERRMDEHTIKQEFRAYVDALEGSLFTFYRDLAQNLNIQGINQMGELSSSGDVQQLMRMVYEDPRLRLSRGGVVLGEPLKGVEEAAERERIAQAERLITSFTSSRPEYWGMDVHDKEPSSRPIDLNDVERHGAVFNLMRQTRASLIDVYVPIKFSPADKHIIATLDGLTPERLMEYRS